MPVDVDRECMATSTAKYRLTFTGQWAQTAFPKHYPLYRPPAQWSPVIGEWVDLISKNRVIVNIILLKCVTFAIPLFVSVGGFDPD